MNSRKIEEKVSEILQSMNMNYPPVPVDEVAQYLGLTVEKIQLSENVSGILVLDGDVGTIGVNAGHALVRRRFSVAHEIGHYVLHKTDKSLFIDKKYIAVYQRNEKSATGEDLLEIQANRFAAALLMPADMIRNAVNQKDFDFGDELALESLAQKFNVSTQAMAYRLANLGLFELPEQLS
jgi:Zn-dependent peptidase ImmA (M78 family)